MSEALSKDEVTKRLLSFIAETFLDGDPQGELDENTPLLEWGILNSLNTARLISYIRNEFDTAVPLEQVTASTFGSVNLIASMICGIEAE